MNFEDLQLQTLKVTQGILEQKRDSVIDECNEIRCKIWEIEMRRSVEEGG